MAQRVMPWCPCKQQAAAFARSCRAHTLPAGQGQNHLSACSLDIHVQAIHGSDGDDSGVALALTGLGKPEGEALRQQGQHHARLQQRQVLPQAVAWALDEGHKLVQPLCLVELVVLSVRQEALGTEHPGVLVHVVGALQHAGHHDACRQLVAHDGVVGGKLAGDHRDHTVLAQGLFQHRQRIRHAVHLTPGGGRALRGGLGENSGRLCSHLAQDVGVLAQLKAAPRQHGSAGFVACQQEGLDLVAQLSLQRFIPCLARFLDGVHDPVQDVLARAQHTFLTRLPPIPEVVDQERVQGPHPSVEAPPLRQDGQVHPIGAQHTPIGLFHHRQVQRRENPVAFLRVQAQDRVSNDLQREQPELLLQIHSHPSPPPCLQLGGQPVDCALGNGDDVIKDACAQGGAN
mmetsp:Transcript_3124/g.8247  ORF Transcript_3124/g.8247 Transcript_3124/m.8247 type:complete len:401 (+) Transcript_3124:1915-3117(+)